ncbi:MAG: rod shape-determining protein MreD [[Actinobacillus] rossii]|uniref:Rod shape-determining protein MreD n=1 Tax=[Actinobacillus] rossii TaxID=123820 RepID=A0A380TQ76_9PAST|nr:rod shape-determining protein MreD [[Actinobacillus] rossii]MDY3123472.1 rod shape-determining protein MreD [[Actinobacillus] rossii]SUT89589.1 rod shape-determining protein MreD [[Actinobacillus] rossii]
MNGRIFIQLFGLCAIFVIALVLEIAPWPTGFQALKPAWLVLVLTYWILALPTKINVGTAFILGVIWDVVIGSILGLHGLVLSILAYTLARYNQILANLSLWTQSLLMIVVVFILQLGIFLVELCIHSTTFNWQEIFGAIISGALWPWLFLLLRRIQRQLGLNA